MKGLQDEMKGMRKDMNTRIEKLEKQQAKTNMELGEMRLSYMKVDKRLEQTNNQLAEINTNLVDNMINTEKVNDHEKRITKLERKYIH